MSGSLLCVAVGTLLLSPTLDAAPASAKLSPPSLDAICVKDLQGLTRTAREHTHAILNTSFSSESQATAPEVITNAPAIVSKSAVVCGDEPGIVFVIGGLGGGESLSQHSQRVFCSCCLPHEICPYHWCHGKRHHLQDLFDHGNVMCQSEDFAAHIMAFREQHPCRPIYVMAWSAGVGVALGAAEKLPPDTIDRMILMCAACSRHYNLSCALRATRCGIVSFHSPMDHFYLNAVLRCLGTIDRVHGMGAGVTGFVTPCCLSCEDQELYNRRLFQVPWRPHMILDGHPGGHLWYKSDRFLSAHVVPWLRTCSSDFIPVGMSAEVSSAVSLPISPAATPVLTPEMLNTPAALAGKQ